MVFQTTARREHRTQAEVERDVRIAVNATMSAEQAEQLVQFTKRALFDSCYAVTEAPFAAG
ncbi:MAG: hypothetical protein CBCREVIR_1713 [Candidatus Burkholderia crenata]|nr:MAG: hypothetical protein CBCREVIR_1713 [Candidatus Burkholderia crenata]